MSERTPERVPLHVVMAVANNAYPQDVRVRREARSLRSAGHRVTVIAPAEPDQDRVDEVDGVRVRRYASPPTGTGALAYVVEFAYSAWAVAIALAGVWRRDGFDVIHVHNPPDTLFLACVLPKLLGKRVVFDHHDLAPELYRAKFASRGGGSPLIVGALRALEWASCRLADRVITANDSYRRVDVERNGVPPERVTVVRNGPSRDRLAEAVPDPGARGGADFVVGYLGNIAAQDGVDHLVRAVAHLRHELGMASVRAVVIGPADDPEALPSLARELGVAEHVLFTGYRPDGEWRSMLAATDACVVPDPPNGLNEKSTMIKTMEYMALGKPVVAYDMSENRVSAGEAALYARPGDHEDMAALLARLARDPELRERMGHEGRRRIRDGLAWEYSEERLLELYDELSLGARPDAPTVRPLAGRGE